MDESDEERESFSCFGNIRWGNFLNSKLDNCIDENDFPSYDELSHALNELHEKMTSLCLKNNALKVKTFIFVKRN